MKLIYILLAIIIGVVFGIASYFLMISFWIGLISLLNWNNFFTYENIWPFCKSMHLGISIIRLLGYSAFICGGWFFGGMFYVINDEIN